MRLSEGKHRVTVMKITFNRKSVNGSTSFTLHLKGGNTVNTELGGHISQLLNPSDFTAVGGRAAVITVNRRGTVCAAQFS